MTNSEFKPAPLPLDGVETPRFYEWNTAPVRWELLAARLLDRDPLYKASDLFEERGFKQYGLDALAEIRTGGQVGLSAKCYEAATPAKIRTWSTEFLGHWDDYWSKRDLRVFILAVAAPNIVNAGNRDQIAEEKSRFAKLGIDYQVWGPEPVYDRLRLHADLVSRFLGNPWRDMIFGAPVASTTAVDTILLRQLEQTQGVVADQVRARLSGAQELLWEGERGQVDALLATVQAPTVWPLLPSDLKAEALRIAARVAIDDDRLEEADDHASAAQALSPAGGLIEAKIAQARSGPDAALVALVSPSSQSDRRYEASLYIAKGDFAEGERRLSAINEPSDDPAETDRILTFIRLGQGRFAEALTLSETAHDGAPRRRLVRLGLAVSRYAAGLSPFTPPVFALRAVCPPAELVRHDTASVARRRAALEVFRSFEGSAFGDKIGVRDWILVCLVNLPDAEAEAVALVEARLAASPLDLSAAFTALTRNYPTELAPTRDALRRLIDSGEVDDDQLKFYAQLRLREAPQGEVLEELVAASATLAGEAAEEAARWIDVLRSEPEGAEDDPVARLAGWLREEPPNLMALELAGQLARAGRWSNLAPFRDQIDAFETPTSTSLVAYIVHHTGAPQALLDYVDANAEAYPNGELPLDIRRMRLSALSDLDPQRAIGVSQALVLETGDASDRRHLVGLLLESGTVQTALPIIRRLLSDGAVRGGDAIRYSVAVTGEDRTLARQLWRHAMKEGVPDSFLLHALSQGYRLGLDEEVAPLMPRMAARAQSGAGDVWTFSVDDLPALISERRNHVEDVRSKLLDGLIPAHFAGSALGSLAIRYRLDLDLDRAGPQPLILIRHGSRAADQLPPRPWRDWQIILDPTALLIADQLELLDHVESLPKPTLIARSLQEALYAFEQDVAPGQPARVDAARTVLAALASGRLTAASDYAPENSVVHERGCKDVGHTVAEVSAFLSDGDAADTGLVPGAQLVFTVGTLESIAMTGSLDPLLSAFRCEIVPEDLKDAASEIRGAEQRESLATTIRVLRERIALGLSTGRYAYLPDAPDDAADDELDDAPEDEEDAPPDSAEGRRPRRRSPLEACLVRNLLAPPDPARVLWVDDRMTSGYQRSQDHPIVTTVEVLNALVKDGALTPDDRRAKLLRLRQGGAAFIPMTADEVLKPLRAARLRDGRIVETSDLIILRRNLAAAARQDSHLQISDGRIKPSEQVFVSSMMRLTEDCLRAVWSDPKTAHEERVALSDWIWDNMRTERCVRPLPVDAPGEGNTLLASVTLAGLFTLGSQIDGGIYAERLARRKAYIDWLDHRALRPRSGRARKAWVRRMVEQFRSLYEGTFEIEVDDDERPLVLKLRNDEIRALPEAVQNQLLEKTEFAKAVGIKVQQFITAGPHVFESSAFWASAAKAIRSGTATATTREKNRFTLTWDGDTLQIDAPEPITLAIPFAAVLATDGPARRTAIEGYLNGYDIVSSLRDDVRKAASATRSPAALAQALKPAEEAAVADRYIELDDAFRAGGDVPMALLLPPPARAALHALRLEGTGSLPDRAVRAWRQLEAEFGKLEAFRRLGGLPLDLSELVGDLVPPPPLSAVGTIHVAAARRRLGASAEDTVRGITFLPDEAFALAVDLLEWTRKAYTSDADWLAMPPADQLALCWAHGHRLQTILMRRTDDFAVLRDRFRTFTPDQSIEQELAGPGEVRNDRGGPSLLQGSCLIYHGLAYAFDTATPWLDLDLDVQSVLADRLLAVAPDGIGLDAGLLFAGPLSTNIMGSWLDKDPRNLVTGSLEPLAARQRHMASALEEIETNPTNLSAWRLASLLARGGCDRANAERYVTAVSMADFGMLALTEDGRGICATALEGLVGWASLPPDDLARKLHDLASGYAKVVTGPIRLGDAMSTQAVDPLIVTLLAGAQDGVPASTQLRLHRGAVAAAHGWPALAPVFRLLFERWYGRADPSADGLWAGLVEFRAWA